MAQPHEVQHKMSQLEDFNPFQIIIKQIPLFWERDRLLQFFIQKKLPAPAELNYLYNEFGFRGMAFASFHSRDQTRQVVRGLDHTWVAIGKCLKVEFKKRRTETVANPYKKHALDPVLFSQVEVREEAREEAREGMCEHSERHTRQQTPPLETYQRLMRYQRNPVEKDKLKRFLAQTGDYQEAVNEFAKNRQRETPIGSFYAWMRIRQKTVDQFVEGRSMVSNEQAIHEHSNSDDKPILEMRLATDEDLEQIAAMESQFGLGDQAASWPPLVIKHQGKHVGGQDFGGVASGGRLGIINQASGGMVRQSEG